MFFPDDVGPGDDDTGRIYVFKGEARLVQDEFGAVTDFTLSGTKRDICAELA